MPGIRMVGVVAPALSSCFKRPSASLVSGVLAASCVTAAFAECPSVIHVPQDAPSIDAAIAQVCTGVPLEVVVAPGTWTMSALVPGSKVFNITVRGAGGGETIITDAANGIGLIDVSGGSTNFNCTLKDVTVADVVGSACYAVFDNCLVRDCAATFLTNSLLTKNSRFERCVPISYAAILYTGVGVENCEFIDCSTPILFWSDGPVALRNTTFTNTAGHALRCYASCCASGNNVYTIENCTFTNTSGNAVKLEYTPHPDAPTVRTDFINCTFTDNVSPAGGLGGGAVRVGITGLKPSLPADATLTTFTGCTFTGNAAPNGGAIFAARNHHIELTGCTFASNAATNGRGGAIGQEFGGYEQRLEAEGCTFIGNTAANDAGGALSIVGWDGFMRLDGCTFRENSARVGGALVADRNTYIVEDCTFEDNVATQDYAGAVFMNIARKGSAIRRTNFVGNTSATFAGALYLYGYITMPVEDCAFVGNAATGNGGAFATNLFTDIDMLRCRFDANEASDGSAIYAFGSGLALTIADCAFAGGATGSPAGSAILAGDPGVSVATSSFCASGARPLGALVADAGGNCIAEYCTDFDANGTPDACECATNPALPSCCLGDLFNDGAVNAADLAVVLTQWGEKGPGLEADLDGNGVVNGVDLAIVLSNWGVCGK